MVFGGTGRESGVYCTYNEHHHHIKIRLQWTRLRRNSRCLEKFSSISSPRFPYLAIVVHLHIFLSFALIYDQSFSSFPDEESLRPKKVSG